MPPSATTRGRMRAAPTRSSFIEIPVARRQSGRDAASAVQREAERILAVLQPRDYVVALD